MICCAILALCKEHGLQGPGKDKEEALGTTRIQQQYKELRPKRAIMAGDCQENSWIFHQDSKKLVSGHCGGIGPL
jgi:hypothetical protein